MLPDRDQRLGLALHARRNGGGRDAEIGRAHHLALADRDATLDLREIFAKPDADQQLLDLGEASVRRHAFGIGGELAHRLDIGGEPGQSVRRSLLAVKQTRDRLAVQRDTLADLGRGVGQQRLSRRRRGARHGKEAAAKFRTGL